MIISSNYSLLIQGASGLFSTLNGPISLTNYLSKYMLRDGGVIYGKLNDNLNLRSWKNTIGT